MKRLLDPDSLCALSRGSAILGAGGGGDAHVTLLQALQATEDFGPVPLVDLDELPDDALIMPCAGIGATTVILEKFENGDEGARLREHLQFVTGRPVAALMAIEIGGGNALLPITWAARIGLPVVDADGIGRAFPEIPQVVMHLAGIPASPAVLTDERGNMAVFRTISGDWLELQNENLVALERGRVLASVPDLITVLDSETADAIATEVLRYGQRVTVIAFACDPVWRTERGIAVAGPRAFGYDFDYLPVEELARARA